MDEVTMGKIVGHNKTIVILILIAMLSMVSTVSMAAFQEDDLFATAYDYYLSYHPEKALEYFDNFLRTFPNSSAKDAALFWKAKSLMQLNKAEEAEKAFSQLKMEVPLSPFAPFIDRELSAYKSAHLDNKPTNEMKSIKTEKGEIVRDDKISGLKKEKEDLEKKLTEISDLKQQAEKSLSKAVADKNRMEELLNDSRKNNEDLSRKIAENNQIEADIKKLRSERDELKKGINELKGKNEELRRLSAKADEQEKLYSKTAVLLQQLKDGKEALEKGAGEKDKKISDLDKTFIVMKEKQADELRTRDREIRDLTIKLEGMAKEKQTGEVLLKKLTSEKTAAEEKLREKESRLSALEEEIKKQQSRQAEIKGKGEKAEILAKELSESEETRKKLEKNLSGIKQELQSLKNEREGLQTKIKSLEDKAIREDSSRLKEKDKEKRDISELLKQVKSEKELLEKTLAEKERKIGESENSISMLNEKIKKIEKERELEKQDKLNDRNRLASGKVDQENKQIVMVTKEKEALAGKLKDAEKSVNTTTASIQSLTSDYESLKKKYAALADREKNALQEVSLLKEKTSKYEAPVVSVGRNQFSLKQIIDDSRVSSDVIKKIGVTNIPWRYDNPYNNFILEQALLMEAGNNGVKEDKTVLNLFRERYSLGESEIKYLVTYLTINNLINKKLGEIVGDEKYVRRYYEMNKMVYRTPTSGRRVKGLSIKFSPHDEMEKSLLAVDLLQEVVDGKTFEMVMKEYPGVLAVGPANISELPIFVQEKVARLKEGEISNVISYESKVAFFQLESGKQEYRTFDDVYREIQEKIYKDQALQTRFLWEWFYGLTVKAGVLKHGLFADEIKK